MLQMDIWGRMTRGDRKEGEIEMKSPQAQKRREKCDAQLR